VVSDPGWDSGTKLSWLADKKGRSCSNILIDEADAETLLAHTCAAYLNACIAKENGTPFPLTPDDVKTCYSNSTLGGHAVTDAQLLAFFKQTCA
jgi:hypothetical protein